jgi:hypothetical protein
MVLYYKVLFKKLYNKILTPHRGVFFVFKNLTFEYDKGYNTRHEKDISGIFSIIRTGINGLWCKIRTETPG